VLVVGASGFVGRHVCVALDAAGIASRRATSRPDLVEQNRDGAAWVHLDLNDTTTFAPALDGCRSVIYLYHGLGSGYGYETKEAAAAVAFRSATVSAGINRLIYLGGVAPVGVRSRHLESRRRTGEILRQSPILTLELRAAMVIGKGSTSFNMIRDLAVRLPVLALPPWMDHGSYPIAIDDVVYALLRALYVPLSQPTWLELPGPERCTHRELVKHLASILGTHVVRKPFALLSPNLSARLLSFIGREPKWIVSELVAGLRSDLAPHGPSFWDFIGEKPHCAIQQAILNAIADETSPIEPSIATQERLAARVEPLRGHAE
jgi:uncharacterized protein YbjT (DUF2867 family)